MTGDGPRYRILRRLGQGGMAEVFEAELVGELGFSRRVAIKRMLETAAADPELARRFVDEARIASRLHHANVVAIVDVGILDGLPFHVLELVDGIDAQHLLARAGGALPLEVALAIAGGVAHALDHAHTAADDAGVPLGIVHRDVKPSNVLVSAGGDVKLGDFGIAVAHDRAARTEAGVVAGTLGFIAPEQRTRGTLDGRTDVFALGLTLHALLTGTSPLADAAVELRVLAGEPVPLAPHLPDDIRALLVGALAPSRLDRPSAAQLADAIGAALAPRLVRDDRSLLRDFLAGLDKKPTAARPGALDALLGIEVVLDDPRVPDDGLRHYHTVAASPRAVQRDVPPPRPATVQPVATEEPRPRARRGLSWLLLLVVVLGGGLAVWRLAIGGDSTSTVARTTPDAAAIADAAPAPPADTAVAVIAPADATPVDATPVDAAVAVVTPRDAGGVLIDAAIAKATPRDAAPPLDASVATEIGYLVVSGDESLIGAKVIIDGGFAGFVPNLIAVRVGRHRVEVERTDGTRLPAQDVEVAITHTRKRPAHPRW